MGMRAATGAIAEVVAGNGGFRCHVLGGGAARGICGSGLVDAAALAVERGLIAPNGRLRNGPIALAGPVVITQQDIRELQLAKGATAAGVRILLRQWGATAGDVERVWLAGAFGNYLNRASARRIGLLDFPIEKIEPAGNTASSAPRWRCSRMGSSPACARGCGTCRWPRIRSSRTSTSPV